MIRPDFSASAKVIFCSSLKQRILCVDCSLLFQVRIYDLTEGKGYRIVHQLNLLKVKEKIANMAQELEKDSQENAGG